MSVTVKRNTGWVGSGSKLRLRLNGRETASINEGRMVELELPPTRATLSATQLGVKSNRLEVESGDIVEVTSRGWLRYAWIIMLAIPIIGLFTDLKLSVNIGIIVALGFLFILSLRFIDGFRLRKLKHDRD